MNFYEMKIKVRGKIVWCDLFF